MTRCKVVKCRKKIPSIYKDLYKCRCGNFYCKPHKLDHNCTYNYLEAQQKTLEKAMPIITPPKIDNEI